MSEFSYLDWVSWDDWLYSEEGAQLYGRMNVLLHFQACLYV